MNKLTFEFYTTNEIKPRGWLKKQLRIQADGLSGNLDKMWPDVARSQWIGLDREGWERVPYWLDGFIPLAYLLDDEDLKERAQKYIEAILANQKEDGWICPCADDARGSYDTWAVILISKVLTVYADCTGDERIVGVLTRVLKNFYDHLKAYPLFNWGKFRWYEGIISVSWLYDRIDSEDDKAWLCELVAILREQQFDYDAMFKSEEIKTPKDKWTFEQHVVNNAMAIKAEALWQLFSDSKYGSEGAHKMLDILDNYYGTAVGHFTGDECFSGNSPLQGTELCGVVEAMYSYEWLFAITGETYWLDRLETLAYNALPATISPDMWTHQYDQMVNQVSCIRMWGKPIFGTNNGEAHIFGLEPNFGCCTANFNQGFPKFALSTFYHSGNDIVSASFAPSILSTDIDGTPISIELETNYPFRGALKYTVKTAAPVKFRLLVRVPEYARESIGTDFIIFDKTWDKTETVTVNLEFKTAFIERPNNMVCLKYGPLVFSVAIDEKLVKHEYTRDGVERKYPYCDYEIYPASDWNYAYCKDGNFSICENEIPKYPFSPEKPALEIFADMVKINWGTEDGYPDLCRREPISRYAESSVKKVRLIPYGCTNIRLTETVFAEDN